MSQVIVITSSDEEVPLPNEQDVKSEKNVTPERKDCEMFFEEFYTLCNAEESMDNDGRRILEYLKKKHLSTVHKTSRSYRKLLQRSLKELKVNQKEIFVLIHNVISELDKQSAPTKCSSSTESPSISSSKQAVDGDGLSSKPLESLNEPSTSKDCLMQPMSKRQKLDSDPDVIVSSNPSPPEGESSGSASLQLKIKKLERYLKELSKEITQLQSIELSYDDLDSEDSIYIQEGKLKFRFMKVYKKLCQLKECKPVTGRLMERNIHVKSSSYPAINRKIELFVNNPKRKQDLPDFADICYLVKRASSRNSLGLAESVIEEISKKIFEEVGQKMQKRRQKDFVFEFGCSAIDDEQTDSDPASKDAALQQTLAKNREIAVSSLENVINKYASMKQGTQKNNFNMHSSSEQSNSDKESETDESINVPHP